MSHYYLLLSIFVSLNGRSQPQPTIIRDVVPEVYIIYQSNQYDINFQCLQDDQCRRTIPTQDDDRKRSGREQRLLTCVGPNSTLFDGIIGRDTIDHVNQFEQTDYSRYYTWHQDITPNPNIEMTFSAPLEELPNVTLYFFRRTGGVQVNLPLVSMCFSRNLNFIPCYDITLPSMPGELRNGVVEWLIALPANVTSVTYLRIDFQYDSNDEDEYIFLSEIRIAERLQVQTTMPTPSTITLSTTTTLTQAAMTKTPEDNNVVNITTIITVTSTPAPINDTIVSSSDDEDSVGVAVIIGAVVGTLLLTIVIIIIIMIVIIVCSRRKKSKRADDKNVQLSSSDFPQRHTHSNSADDYVSTSKLEIVDALYAKTKVKPVDLSLKRIDDRPRIGSCDVIITPNPSYSRVDLQSGKEFEYDYVQTENGLVGHDKVFKCITSGGVYDKVTDVTMDTVNIDPNPAYSVGQDVKLEDNPSYDKLKL